MEQAANPAAPNGDAALAADDGDGAAPGGVEEIVMAVDHRAAWKPQITANLNPADAATAARTLEACVAKILSPCDGDDDVEKIHGYASMALGSVLPRLQNWPAAQAAMLMPRHDEGAHTQETMTDTLRQITDTLNTQAAMIKATAVERNIISLRETAGIRGIPPPTANSVNTKATKVPDDKQQRLAELNYLARESETEREIASFPSVQAGLAKYLAAMGSASAEERVSLTKDTVREIASATQDDGHGNSRAFHAQYVRLMNMRTRGAGIINRVEFPGAHAFAMLQDQVVLLMCHTIVRCMDKHGGDTMVASIAPLAWAFLGFGNESGRIDTSPVGVIGEKEFRS